MVYYTDSTILVELAKMRRRDLMTEVETGRLVNKAMSRKFELKKPLLVGLGNFLITVGLKLKMPYEPVSHEIRLGSSLSRPIS